MATLDAAGNAIVLRVVYAGPAEAGKTATLRGLAELVGRPTETPEQAGERTLYFDWMEYTGGLFEEHQLRCQVVTVPGQEMLANRRQVLVASADVVIHVAPVSQQTLPRLLQDLSRLREELGDSEMAPGILVQANKRDLPDALSIDAIRDALRSAGLEVGVVESTATELRGIRETFVLAVRLALDRVRALMSAGALPDGPPDISSAAALLEHVRAAEAGPRSPSRLAAPTVSGIVSGQADDLEAPTYLDSAPPPPPRSDLVPSGHLWPPIGGRLQLEEACGSAPEISRQGANWFGWNDEGWVYSSPVAACFDTLEHGRGALIQQARAHASHADVLSSPRVLALAPDRGRWRLWQILRDHRTVRQRLASRLDAPVSPGLAVALIDAGRRLVDLDVRMQQLAHRHLALSLDVVGLQEGATRYVAPFPYIQGPDAAPELDVDAAMTPVLQAWSPRAEALKAALLEVHPSSFLDLAIAQRLVSLLGPPSAD